MTSGRKRSRQNKPNRPRKRQKTCPCPQDPTTTSACDDRQEQEHEALCLAIRASYDTVVERMLDWPHVDITKNRFELLYFAVTCLSYDAADPDHARGLRILNLLWPRLRTLRKKQWKKLLKARHQFILYHLVLRPGAEPLLVDLCTMYQTHGLSLHHVSDILLSRAIARDCPDLTKILLDSERLLQLEYVVETCLIPNRVRAVIREWLTQQLETCTDTVDCATIQNLLKRLKV